MRVRGGDGSIDRGVRKKIEMAASLSYSTLYWYTSFCFLSLNWPFFFVSCFISIFVAFHISIFISIFIDSNVATNDGD